MKIKTLEKLKQFDPVTEFRLINAFFVSIGMALLSPILITLKGLYLAVWIISMFAIISQLAVKTNDYMTKKFKIPDLYHFGIYIHLSMVVISLIYFYDPIIMIWLESFLVIIEVAVFSSFSILLNNYITDHFPKSMQDFQVIRNSSWADGFLVGLSLVTLMTYFTSIDVAIGFFIVYNFIFSLWMIKNWSFFNDNLEGDYAKI